MGYVVAMKANQLLAYNLKKWRTARQLTQEALAELADLHPRTISRFETSEHFCKAETLDLLAKILNIKVEDFFKSPNK